MAYTFISVYCVSGFHEYSTYRNPPNIDPGGKTLEFFGSYSSLPRLMLRNALPSYRYMDDI